MPRREVVVHGGPDRARAANGEVPIATEGDAEELEGHRIADGAWLPPLQE